MIIASVNFINLSTVRSINRAREIGIRKITGASKKNIIFQFLGESLSLAFIAIFLVFLSLFPLIRIFTNLTGKEILIDSLFLGLMIVFLAFITGIIAGIYPAFVISSFQPTSVLKGRIKGGSRGHLLRKTLLIFQFAISVILIIGARGIFNQLDYMKNMDIGYQKEQVILLPLKGKTSRYFQAFKNQLIQEPGIQGISGSIAGLPYFGWSTGGIDWEGKDSNQRVFVTFNYVDYDFLKTLRIDIKQGRGFSREYPNDKKNYIINEEMARRMGLQSPEEKTLSLWKKPGAVIGVVKDFNYEPLDKKIEPLVLMLRPEKIEFALIRIRPGDISATLKIIKRTWVKIIPSYPFKYQFLDREFNHKYINVERIGKLVKIFSFLAILIACLGLFGLASSDTENRKKEVGIRKTLGAANWKIIFLFTRDFIKWVLVAIIIALPAAWYLINKWLQNFAYHITLSPWFFIAAGVIVFGIALATVCLKTIRAANANPIEALRYE